MANNDNDEKVFIHFIDQLSSEIQKEIMNIKRYGARTRGYAQLDSTGRGIPVSDDDDFDGDEMSTRPEDVDADLTSVEFAQEIKILLITSASWRILCSFLGFDSVTAVKEAQYSNITLIGLLTQQNIVGYMESQGYKFQGEINFDSHDNPIPVTKHCWMLGGKEVSFTSAGFMYFSSKDDDRNKNIVIYCWKDPNTGMAGFYVYSHSTEESKQFTINIEEYAKKNNCFRGAKIRDVNMVAATFEEVEVTGKYTWENYYFSQNVRNMFDLEVFGFLKNVERYNARGISKRGVLMHGVPGTGKTTIGHLICNYAENHTVIWITPELISENNTNKHSVKLLYALADFVSPVVIILEDLDLFSEDREHGGDTLRLGALMNVLDGVNSVKNAVTIATTNRLDMIEKALSNRPGRFDRVISIPPLEESLRRKMVKARLQGFNIADNLLEHIVKNTEEWTPAELQEFINSLNLYFINVGDDKAEQVITQQIIDTVFSVIGKYCVGHKSKKGIGFGS